MRNLQLEETSATSQRKFGPHPYPLEAPSWWDLEVGTTLYLVGKVSDEYVRLSSVRFLVYVEIYEMILDHDESLHRYGISIFVDTFITKDLVTCLAKQV